MNSKQFLVALVWLSVVAFLGGMAANEIFHSQPVEAVEKIEKNLLGGTNCAQFLGLVKGGKFHILHPASQLPLTGSARLTQIQMQEARPPDSAEIDLTPYEGKAIMVTGHDGGGWIYRAAVVDSGGPIVTALVEKVFTPCQPGPKDK